MSESEGSSRVRLYAIPSFSTGVRRGKIETNAQSKPSLRKLVSGPNRCKYFKQPVKVKRKIDDKQEPFQIPAWLKTCVAPEPPLMVCTATQSDYRENETQTEPWDPPYKAVGNPEILTLKSLIYGKGLPVTKDRAVADIQRARETRVIEESLLTCENEAERAEKYQMLVQQKLKELAVTISDVRSQYIKKLTKVKMSLEDEVCRRESRRVEILANMWEVKKEDLENKTRRLQEQFDRSAHILHRKRSALTTTAKPLTMEALLKSKNPNFEAALHVDYPPVRPTIPPNYYLSNPEGLVELQRWMWEEQKILMDPEIRLPDTQDLPESFQKAVEETEDLILKNLRKSPPPKKPRGQRGPLPKPVLITPEVPEISETLLLQEHSTIILQKTFRGRAMQKEIRTIQAKYAALIREMRETLPWTEEEQLEINKEKEQKHLHYITKRNNEYKVKDQNEVISRFEGDVINPKLRVLSKASDRYSNLQEILEIVVVAKDIRRRREAEEAGRRQQELTQRDLLSQIFNEVMESQESIINRFLEDVLGKLH